MNTSVKPRIMLVPDTVDWILGTWAKEIAKWKSTKYEFVIFPMGEVRENPDLFRSVLAQVDMVHCLTQSAFGELKTAIAKTESPHLEVISTVHHIVKISQVADCLEADKIMVVCKKYLNELLAHGVPREKVALIYNGVDTNLFSPSDRAGAKKSFGIPDGAFAVGFAGKATSDHDGRKGIDVFCRTLSRLPDQIKGDVHVVLTGPGWEHLQKDAAFDRIVFHYSPFLPAARMPQFYNAVDVYLVTAKVEGGPVPLLEAMSCGIPVVTTPVGTALDFVRDGHNGLMVPIGDFEATVDAIERIQRDRNLAARLGFDGRATILKNLQWKDTVLKVDQLYCESKRAGNRANLHTAEAISCAEMNAMLVEKDTARWQRGIAPQAKGLNNELRAGFQMLTSLPKRLYSKVGRSLRSGN